MLRLEIIGNLGADAEIKEFGGKKYVSFSVAHSEYSRDMQGNSQETTIWVSVLWYGDGGKVLQYLRRGSKVFVRGRQSVGLYTDKNGHTQYSINISANEVQLCGVKGENNNQQQSNSAQNYQPSAQPGNSGDAFDSVDGLPF